MDKFYNLHASVCTNNSRLTAPKSHYFSIVCHDLGVYFTPQIGHVEVCIMNLFMPKVCSVSMATHKQKQTACFACGLGL